MSVDVRDMDRDGDLDVVVGEHNYKEPQTARLLVFENVDGRGRSWKQYVVYTGDEHHDGAQVVDIDNDGDLADTRKQVEDLHRRLLDMSKADRRA